MIKKLKQADFYEEEDLIIRILMYFDDKDNKIYIEKDVLSNIDTYTDRIDSVESDQDMEADMLYIHYCEYEMRKWMKLN